MYIYVDMKHKPTIVVYIQYDTMVLVKYEFIWFVYMPWDANSGIWFSNHAMKHGMI